MAALCRLCVFGTSEAECNLRNACLAPCVCPATVAYVTTRVLCYCCPCCCPSPTILYQKRRPAARAGAAAAPAQLIIDRDAETSARFVVL